MLALLLIVFFAVDSVLEIGMMGTLLATLVALGVDAGTALITGTSLAHIFTGVGLADDFIVMFLGQDLAIPQKLALSVFLEEFGHIKTEAEEWHDHTDWQNEQYSRYLARHFPNETFLFGDVTPLDLIDFGLSTGYLVHKRTFSTLLDAAKGKFGGLVDLTSDIIEIGGA